MSRAAGFDQVVNFLAKNNHRHKIKRKKHSD